MKKILREIILSLIFVVIATYIISLYWKSKWLYAIAGFFILGSIAFYFDEKNKLSKREWFNNLNINLSLSIPTFCFLGHYEMTDVSYVEKQVDIVVEYSICLVSNLALYFYRCEKRFITPDKFVDNTILDNLSSLKKPIATVNKDEITSITFAEINKTTQEKFGKWIGNQISSRLSNIKSYSMNATVNIHFIKNNTKNLLIFGIPEKMPDTSIFSLESFFPEDVTAIPSAVGEFIEFFEIFEADNHSVQIAKKLSNHLTNTINA